MRSFFTAFTPGTCQAVQDAWALVVMSGTQVVLHARDAVEPLDDDSGVTRTARARFRPESRVYASGEIAVWSEWLTSDHVFFGETMHLHGPKPLIRKGSQ